MATRRELQKLACLRLKEAEALFDAGCYDGCAYLCGYVVELALKAAICATLDITQYPEKGSRLREALKTHDFDDLKLLASMELAFTLGNKRFGYWSAASKWKPERRYDPEGTYDRAAAIEILDAVRSYPEGVLACISQRW
jgi:HEPN domain-containing protein